MNPQYTDGPGFAFPPLTPAIKRLLLVNVALFLVNAIALAARPQGIIEWFELSAPGLLDGYGLGVLRLITYQFVHNPLGLMHLIGNMLMMYFLGGMAEQLIGYRGTYKLYLFAGLVGGLGHLLSAWAFGKPEMAVIGASGACYGLMVYAACRRPQTTILLIVIPVPLIVLMWILLAVGIYASYIELVTGLGSATAHGAHLGGALGGFLVYKFGWFTDHVPYAYNEGLIGGMRRRMREAGARREARRRQVHQETMDRLLEKIKEKGMDSLTSAERTFLQKASKDLNNRR